MATKSVLLVEDNDDNLSIYSTILRHFGYDVLEATDGAAALEMASARLPNLILMDVSIPIMDGWEATRRIKADPATAHIPIIALTAHALASDRERAKEVGCDDYISKPAEPRTVVEAVQRFIGAASTESHAGS